MGKALLLFVLALSTLFSTGILNMSRQSLESVNTYSDHYRQLAARNAAVSGVYMSFSKLSQDSTWRSGFNGSDALSLDGSVVNVNLVDSSEWRVNIESIASNENISDTIWVVLRMPPDLEETAIFSTDAITNVLTFDDPGDGGNLNSSLQIENAPEMIPFDKDALIALAQSQTIPSSHVINVDYAPPDGWPNWSFYYDFPANTKPNVTWIKGDLVVNGNKDIYGIFVVEGDVTVTITGNSKLYGVIYLPNLGSVIIHGGGSPSDMSVYGGIFANGPVTGTGNHIFVQLFKEYMEFFSKYQQSKNLYILSWTESNFY